MTVCHCLSVDKDTYLSKKKSLYCQQSPRVITNSSMKQKLYGEFFGFYNKSGFVL